MTETLIQPDRQTIYQQFDISSYGFLPDKPIPKLDDEFQPWEDFVDQLSELNKSSQTRAQVTYLPDFSWQTLNTPEQWKRAYTILTLVTNSYVNSQSTPVNTLPAKIAVPVTKVSEHLGIKPLLTHATVDLYNWKIKDDTQPFSLDNLESVSLVTGTFDESWFYLIMVAIEKEGGKIIDLIFDSCDGIQCNSPSLVLKSLKQITEYLEKICTIIKRTREKCKPDVFWNQLRPYLSGWTDKTKFPDGLIYEGAYDNAPVVLNGGSAAQSSLFATIDAALQIKHRDAYFDMIMNYMPGKHKEFILFVRENVHILDYINMIKSDDLMEAYDDVIKTITKFRDLHYGLVFRYIVKMVYDDIIKEGGEVPSLEELEATLDGSGGTKLRNFLKGAIRDTSDNMIKGRTGLKELLYEKCIE